MQCIILSHLEDIFILETDNGLGKFYAFKRAGLDIDFYFNMCVISITIFHFYSKINFLNFITGWTFFSECWCNGLLKCVPFTYQK